MQDVVNNFMRFRRGEALSASLFLSTFPPLLLLPQVQIKCTQATGRVQHVTERFEGRDQERSH